MELLSQSKSIHLTVSIRYWLTCSPSLRYLHQVNKVDTYSTEVYLQIDMNPFTTIFATTWLSVVLLQVSPNQSYNEGQSNHDHSSFFSFFFFYFEVFAQDYII